MAKSSPSKNPSGVIIDHVEPDGLGQQAGVRVGDRLVTINGEPIRDAIDLRFHEVDEQLNIAFRRGERMRRVRIDKEYGDSLGVELRPFKIRQCRNKCVFCFVHQQPAGVRASALIRDDDYRLSFLHGAYITGTNLTAADQERIADQRLAPLYISVQAIDPVLRGRLLGRPKPTPVTPLLDFMVEHDLTFHTQVVLCPGLNDGAALNETLEALAGYHPCCQSIALVPVGLTRHRQSLCSLTLYDGPSACELIDSTASLRRRLARQLGEDIVFFSDEFYLTAQRPAPRYRLRDYTPQIENGVGVLYDFYKGFRPGRRPRRLASPHRVALITGHLGPAALAPLVEALNQIDNLNVDLLPVENRFYGPTVTVSGLLVGADIRRAIAEASARYDWFFLPPNCLRHDRDVFLDDLTLEQLQSQCPVPITIGGADAATTFGKILDCLGDSRKNEAMV